MIVVLPTYNEAGNLPVLVPQLLDIAPVRVLIVDDDSPDGTGQVAESLKKSTVQGWQSSIGTVCPVAWVWPTQMGSRRRSNRERT